MLPRGCDNTGCSDMILSWSSCVDANVGSEKGQGGIEFRLNSNHGNAIRSLPGQVTRGYGYGDHKQIASPRALTSSLCQLYRYDCCPASRPGFCCIHTLLSTLQPYQSGGTWSLESDGGTRKEGGEFLFHRRTLCESDLTPCSC